MPSEFGDFRVFAFNMNDGREAAAMVAGDVEGKEDVLVRVHSECFTGDDGRPAATAARSCRRRSTSSQKKDGCGCLSPTGGQGIGLLNKIKATPGAGPRTPLTNLDLRVREVSRS